MSHNSLSKNAQIVQNVLNQKGLEFKVVELPADTVPLTKQQPQVDCQVGQIIKSILFVTHNTRKPILVLASGHIDQ